MHEQRPGRLGPLIGFEAFVLELRPEGERFYIATLYLGQGRLPTP